MHIYFSVGEPSGDAHASNLIEDIRLRQPGVRISGYGGPKMRQAGCEVLFELTQMAVMGVVAVIPKLFEFYRLVKQAGEYLREERPDAVVLIDFPGFNFWIARKAKRLGIPVFYYMPPQLWAWASWRIRRVRKNVDHVLSPLQFETQWYRHRGVDAHFVGHPFFDEVAAHQLDANFLSRHERKPGPLLGILPGSRNQEVARNWPIQLDTIRALHRTHPTTRFLVACFNEQHLRECRSALTTKDRAMPMEFHVGRTSEIIELADACLMVSGSVSLELLARHTPAVVVYAVMRPFHRLTRILIRCRYMTLVNLMADREIMPEFFTGSPHRDVSAITNVLQTWLENPEILRQKSAELRQLAATAVKKGATTDAATEILSHLTPETPRNKKLRAAA